MRSILPSRSLSSAAIFAIVAFGAALAFTSATEVQAHTASAHYSSEWSSDVNYNIGFRHLGFNNSTFTNSVHAADNPWDSVSGNWFDFNWGIQNATVTTWGGCLTVPTGGVWVGTGNISALGSESTCTNAAGITRSSITIDRIGPLWHQGSSTSVPSNSYDLRSVLIHEFGHASGFAGHFSHSSITDCTGSDRNTMCSGLPKGTSYKRSLESHDKHTIANAY